MTWKRRIQSLGEYQEAYLVESDPDAGRDGVVAVRSLAAVAEGREREVLVSVELSVLTFDVIEDIDVDLSVALVGVVVLDGDAVVVAEARRLSGVHWAELGESVEAGDLQTSLEARLLVVDSRLHDRDGGHEKTGEEGEVGDVEDRDLD